MAAEGNSEQCLGKAGCEIWKDVKDYEGLYQVSNYGNVRSLEHKITRKTKGGAWQTATMKGRVLKFGFDKDGYMQVALSKNGKVSQKKVHRLVADAFIPKVCGKDFINHIDSNKQNNRVTNLEWCTPHENLIHAYKHGYKTPTRPKRVIQRDKNGNFIKCWSSIKEACRNTKAYPASVKRACAQNGTSGGYKWEFTE